MSCVRILPHTSPRSSPPKCSAAQACTFTERRWLYGRHSSVLTLLDDETYFDSLYATLTAWGMHRMGPGNTKLLDIATIRDGVRKNTKRLEDLQTLNITTVTQDQQEEVIDALWAVLADLWVSVAEARIVANSKLLHHILPGLVPPIDREYTFGVCLQSEDAEHR